MSSSKQKNDGPEYEVEYRQSEAGRQMDSAQISLTLWRIYQMALDRAHEVHEVRVEDLPQSHVQALLDAGRVEDAGRLLPRAEFQRKAVDHAYASEYSNASTLPGAAGMFSGAYDAVLGDDSECPGDQQGDVA